MVSSFFIVRSITRGIVRNKKMTAMILK